MSSQHINVGKVYLQFLQEQISTCKALPTGVPIPVKFRTEDGWEFELNSDRSAYESADGSIMLVSEVLKLMLMDDQESWTKSLNF